MPVLSGNYPETCFAKYGSMPLKAKYVHEMSLRILLHAIDSTANKYSRHIVPWISLSVDFYIRGMCCFVLWSPVLYCAAFHCTTLYLLCGVELYCNVLYYADFAVSHRNHGIDHAISCCILSHCALYKII